MFLLLTDYHSTKKVLVNLDDVRRVDVFQEAFARLTFKDKEVFDTSESFENVSEYILQWQPMNEYGDISHEAFPGLPPPIDPSYVTHAQEYAARIVDLPHTFSPPDIQDIPKRD